MNRGWVLAALLVLGGCAAGPLRSTGEALAVTPAEPGGTRATQRDKGFSPSRTTREALDESFAPRRIAVVVGVGTYQDPTFPSLRWAEHDASEVGRIFSDPAYGGFDRVVHLVGPGQVRRDRVLAELSALRADMRRQDTVVVYISSHGTLALGADGEPRLFLVAEDTRPSDLVGTGIELAELQRFFSEMRAERKALILDACYNGESKSRVQPTVLQRVGQYGEAPTLSRTVRLGESEAHLFASTFGRPAREDDQLRHGVYTYHLLEAMTWNQQLADRTGDGVVTIYEAHDYARLQTVAYTQGAQVPEAYFRVVGHNDLVLTGSEEARIAADIGLIYYYGPDSDPMSGAELSVDGRVKGSFPGTFAVERGPHRVTVTGEAGERIQDRVIEVSPGVPVEASTLRHQPRAWLGFLNLGATGRLTPSTVLRPLVGRAWLGLELWGGARLPAGLPGLTLSAGLGYAPQQARFVSGATEAFRPRHLVHAGVGVGGRTAGARGWFGGGWRGRAQLLSALDGPGCSAVAACDQWFWFSQGLNVEQGIRLGSRWSLLLEESLDLALLDGGEGLTPAWTVGLRVGIEVGL